MNSTRKTANVLRFSLPVLKGMKFEGFSMEQTSLLQSENYYDELCLQSTRKYA